MKELPSLGKGGSPQGALHPKSSTTIFTLSRFEIGLLGSFGDVWHSTDAGAERARGCIRTPGLQPESAESEALKSSSGERWERVAEGIVRWRVWAVRILRGGIVHECVRVRPKAKI